MDVLGAGHGPRQTDTPAQATPMAVPAEVGERVVRGVGVELDGHQRRGLHCCRPLQDNNQGRLQAGRDEWGRGGHQGRVSKSGAPTAEAGTLLGARHNVFPTPTYLRVHHCHSRAKQVGRRVCWGQVHRMSAGCEMLSGGQRFNGLAALDLTWSAI